MEQLSKNQRRRKRLQQKKDKDYDVIDEFLELNKDEQSKDENIKNNDENKDDKSKNDDTGDKDDKQKNKDDNSKKLSSEQAMKVTREQIVEKAKQLWDEIHKYVKDHPSIKNMKDKDKMDIFRTRLGYGQFMDEFPIVSRYMICMGQFSTKAFNRYLDQLERKAKTQLPPAERSKDYAEDEWIKRQADYVQYLWEAYHKNHFNSEERKWVWRETYNKLKGEFSDFRNKYKDVEEKVKEEKVDLAAQNVVDLLERLKTGKQQVNEQEEKFLMASLDALFIRRNMLNALANLQTNSLVQKLQEGTKAFDSIGNGPEENRKITMIETVDTKDMERIPDKYKPDEYKGMRPVDDEIVDVIEEVE